MDRTPAYLADMLQFVRELREVVHGKALDEFVADRVLCLAVERLFINVGEAAKRIDPTESAQMPDIPWTQIIGLRNILAHGYEQVDHEVLYKSISEDLPALQVGLETWLAAKRHS
ncbi:HepT-like ribonuclease domain-containing protein [Caenimonas soli]|uniref:HepT-like ribonuclease domain-containing protein n=1 Tax=Caenimonas soli TaxID=2735555 RepID=UPI00155624D7|nr:HepT-like ribonuclease domain-containing protein [Caenimonas soli]NPC55203.1 DUF86 domain-containing protein [Caenimonas soli]